MHCYFHSMLGPATDGCLYFPSASWMIAWISNLFYERVCTRAVVDFIIVHSISFSLATWTPHAWMAFMHAAQALMCTVYVGVFGKQLAFWHIVLIHESNQSNQSINQVKSNLNNQSIKSINQIKSNQIRSNQIKSNPIKSNQSINQSNQLNQSINPINQSNQGRRHGPYS